VATSRRGGPREASRPGRRTVRALRAGAEAAGVATGVAPTPTPTPLRPPNKPHPRQLRGLLPLLPLLGFWVSFWGP